MSTTSMNIRVNSEVKKQAEELFAVFGLNMTTAVNMFLRQSIRKQAVPFELSLKPTQTGENNGYYVHEGKGELSLMDLIGKIEFADGYDHKALRKGRNDTR